MLIVAQALSLDRNTNEDYISKADIYNIPASKVVRVTAEEHTKDENSKAIVPKVNFTFVMEDRDHVFSVVAPFDRETKIVTGFINIDAFTESMLRIITSELVGNPVETVDLTVFAESFI